MQHIEFLHTDHFNQQYHRIKAVDELLPYIDFFWETRFDELWNIYPDGFSDVLFPNTGYTYLINLGSPFIMQIGNRKFNMKTDGFLPRHDALECYHKSGNKLFGIKFKVSPILLEKKINFSEYRDYIFPLSYLVDKAVLDQVKKCGSFHERVYLLTAYFKQTLNRYAGTSTPVHIVSEVLKTWETSNDFTTSIEDIAARYNISSRTLQRYFEAATGMSTKQARQTLRIRRATEKLVMSPETFDSSDYGYYDHSHFYKHLRQFLQKDTISRLQFHLRLLEKKHEHRQ